MKLSTLVRIAIASVSMTGAAFADEVTDWNRVLLNALSAPPALGAPLTVRPAAIVHAAIFDAVNGIDRRYSPLYIKASAPTGASERAAAVQAAYAALVHLFPAQTATFDQQRTASLAAIANGPSPDSNDALQRGIAWGQAVADAIWAIRSADGFSNVQPPYTGGTQAGQWQPTPPAFAAAVAPQIAKMTPWVITSPSQFRPSGPPALTSAQYTADFNETKSMGSATSSTRTDEETLYVKFWASTSPPGFWDPVAVSLATQNNFTLIENARLLAQLNVALADAIIGCWDAKFTYSSWRPVTAIRLAALDQNPDTIPDPAWDPLIVTPAFPEYPSAHSCASSAATAVLAHNFGENTPISIVSDGMPGVIRNFPRFAAALDEVANARVFGGIHFRTATNDGRSLGSGVGAYIVTHAFTTSLKASSGRSRELGRVGGCRPTFSQQSASCE